MLVISQVPFNLVPCPETPVVAPVIVILSPSILAYTFFAVQPSVEVVIPLIVVVV